MKNERLTAANILALRCPEQLDRKFYPDAKVPGLALCVLRSGERRWYIKKKRGGASIRVMLGDARVLTLAQARDRAQKLLGQVSDGADLMAERRARKTRGITVSDALESYIGDHVNLKPRSIADYRTILKRHAEDWKRKPLAEITGPLLRARHRKIGATNRAGANYLVRVIRMVWNWAAVGDPKTFGANPARELSAKRSWYAVEAKRTRLAPHEIGPWWRAVSALDAPARDFLPLLLLLGLRVGEAGRIRGVHVDAKGATLDIPEAKAAARIAYPGPHSLALLAKLKEAAGDGPLFPSQDAYQTAIRKRLGKANAQADVGSLSFHCLRRSYASILEAIGAPYVVTKTLLGHKLQTNDVTSSYIVPTAG